MYELPPLLCYHTVNFMLSQRLAKFIYSLAPNFGQLFVKLPQYRSLIRREQKIDGIKNVKVLINAFSND